jgi:AcrR family transcriptional regulator
MPAEDRDDQAVQSGRRKRPPLVSRRQAVDAAYDLIAAEGPDGLSMRKLAAALHVSLPTVYTAVDSRDTLIGELQDRLIAEMVGAVTVDSLIEHGAELGDAAAHLLRWARDRAPLAEFLIVEPMNAAVAERALAAATPEQRAAGRAVLAAIAGDAGASLEPVCAVAFVLTEVRAMLWLASQERLAPVDPSTWLEIGCANVTRGLLVLSDTQAKRN